MSKLLEILSRVEAAITSNSPTIQAVEGAVNAAADIAAAAIPGATAAVAAIHVAEAGINTAINAASGLASAAISALATDGAPALTSAQVAAITTLPVSTVDPATLAAGGVANAAADEGTLAGRVATLEASIVELLGVVKEIAVPLAQIAKQFGL